jgi:hypothetical protein
MVEELSSGTLIMIPEIAALVTGCVGIAFRVVSLENDSPLFSFPETGPEKADGSSLGTRAAAGSSCAWEDCCKRLRPENEASCCYSSNVGRKEDGCDHSFSESADDAGSSLPAAASSSSTATTKQPYGSSHSKRASRNGARVWNAPIL